MVVMVLSLGTAVVGVVVGLYFCWRVALVVLGCLPLMAFGRRMWFRFLVNSGIASEEFYQDSTDLASHAIHNIRMVSALNANVNFLRDYVHELNRLTQEVFLKLTKAGLIIGFSEFVVIATFAVSFYYGAVNVQDRHCTIQVECVSSYGR